MVRRLGRCRAVAIAAQVGGDDMEVLGQTRRHRMPGDMGQRIAVQQQQRRPAAAMPQPDARPAGLDVSEGEAGHDVHGQFPSCVAEVCHPAGGSASRIRH
ncbi:hypothetical protein ACFQU2_04505 [Siccirubricoccus deserti]